jgi:uncharacterized phage-associated protein
VISAELVAAYIHQKLPDASGGVKLQKLLYYSQAWHLVWLGRPLFNDRIEAWKMGPVVPVVFKANKYESLPTFSQSQIPSESLAVIDEVVRAYGSRNGQFLSDLTHKEEPWKQARIGLSESDASQAEIKIDSLNQSYSAHAYGKNQRFSDAYLLGLELMVELPEDEIELMRNPEFIAYP